MKNNDILAMETDVVRKLCDYILLNAYSVNSTGLYNGKAGFALCLFDVAYKLHDEYLEEQAYELLQEALLSRNEDIGFENGLMEKGMKTTNLKSSCPTIVSGNTIQKQTR